MNTNILFSDLYISYSKYISLKKKPQSLRTEVNVFINHLLPYFKDFKVKDITFGIYQDFLYSIKSKGFKISYMNRIHTHMCSILDYAIVNDYINFNVAKKVGGFSKKNQSSGIHDIWTLEEFQNFISYVDRPLFKLLFSTLFFTGARIGETLALTWNDINFEKEYLDINKTIAKETDSNNDRIISTPKTPSSIRHISLDKTLVKMYKSYLNDEKKNISFSYNNYIFGGSNPISQSTVTRNKNKYCELSNTKKIRLHDFRHSHATLLISNGIPINNLSHRLGHSNVFTTLNTYSHYIEQYDSTTDLLSSLHTTIKY